MTDLKKTIPNEKGFQAKMPEILHYLVVPQGLGPWTR